MRRFKTTSFYVISLTLFLLGIVFQSFAAELRLPEGLTLSGYLKNETYLRLSGTPDNVMSCRNVANLDINYYTPGTLPIVRRIFVQLRPFYDASFALGGNQRGDDNGGAASIITLPPTTGNHMRQKFQDNFGTANEWDPLVRESWADIKIGDHLDGRLGRQLVSWGRSDGIYLLDLINPFNYRNWSVFEEEDDKIPNWMVNLTYSFNAFNSLQLLVIPHYIPEMDGADGHDWTPNVVNYVRDFYADPGAFFGFPGAFGQYHVRYHEPDSGNPNDWAWAVRWGGAWGGLNYSLNYLYTWSFVENDWTKGPNLVVREPNRLTVMGGSFDYNFANALGLENLVLRGEAAYFQHAVFTDANFNKVFNDHFDYMLGFDKYFFVDYWLSLQVKESILVNPPQWNRAFLSVSCQLNQLETIPGVGTFPVSQGFIQPIFTEVSLYAMKDWTPGKYLHSEAFLLWTSEGDWWFRPKVKYDWTNKFHTSLGFNIYWSRQDGKHDTTFGEFDNNRNVFFEIKYDF